MTNFNIMLDTLNLLLNFVYEPQSLAAIKFFLSLLLNVLNWALDEIYYNVESKKACFIN